MTEEIFIYSDHLEYAPGDDVTVRVSASAAQQVAVSLVKPLASGNEATLDFSFSEVVGSTTRQVPATFQHTHNGSFGIIEGVVCPEADADTLTMLAYVWPTMAGKSGQPILTLQGQDAQLELRLNEAGAPVGTLKRTGEHGIEQMASVVGSQTLAERQWYLLAVTATADELRVLQVPVLSNDLRDQPAEQTVGISHLGGFGTSTLLLAADHLLEAPNGSPRSDATFDGKIDAPALLNRAVTLAELVAEDHAEPAWLNDAFAAWDFTTDFETDRFISRIAEQPAGQLFNAPARGMTGRNWTGYSLDYRLTPNEYGAIHFHSDDLEDAAWAETATVTLPTDLASGIYAVRVVGEGCEDHTPFVVRAQSTRNDVLFLLPTFSYLAYANSRLAEELDYSEGVLTNLTPEKQYRDSQVYAHREFGMSVYDHHVDGSGNCYSSHLRPIVNMRWDFRSGLQGAPRHFAADLAWPAWFESEGVGYDVLSDHGLHERGLSSIEGYDLIITGSHPEYWSGDMLDSVEAYLAKGGSFAYVGGNGFYWVTSVHEKRPHLVEVRRGQQGIRTWEGEPGEAVTTQSAEPGGLWRLRGRAPNRLVGVGMAAQGWDTSTPGFERTQASFDPRVVDLFDGIADDEIIGDFGLVLGGAAGDEIDRADTALGTPRHALVIATSQPHSEFYLAAPEEVPTPTPHINGTNNPNVRADITFFEHQGGGFVVSTSAITWTGALAYREFDNNVSQFMRNIVRKAVTAQE